MNFKLCSLLLGVCAMAAPALQAQEDVEITISPSTGTFEANGASSWVHIWNSTRDAGAPGIQLNTTRNNIDKTQTDLTIYRGSADNYCTVAITTVDATDYYIGGYRFDAKRMNASDNVNMTVEGVDYTMTGENKHFEYTLTRGAAPSIRITGDNKGIVFTNFVVTLKSANADEPVLEVDAFPAQKKVGALVMSTIVDNSRFNMFTTWYHIHSGIYGSTPYLKGADLAQGGNTLSFADEFLYCFVKDGETVKVYNKAAGVSAPVEGVTVDADGTVSINGENVKVSFAERYCPVNMTTGKTYRNGSPTDSNKWRSVWKSDYFPGVSFAGSSNCMTTTGSSSSYSGTGDFVLETGSNGSAGNYTWSFTSDEGRVCEYTFLAKREADASDTSVSTITAGGTARTMTNYFQRITVSNIAEGSAANIVENAINGKGVIVSDCYVRVRCTAIPVLHAAGDATIIFNSVSGAAGRIPTIATVGAGEHAGRVIAAYDQRYNSTADLGSGKRISIQITHSDDNGATWAEPYFGKNADNVNTTEANNRLDNASDMVNQAKTYWNSAWGDAAMVGDRESANVLMMACGGPTGFWASRHDNPQSIMRWISPDGGDTWQDAENLTDKIYALFDAEGSIAKCDGMFFGSGRIMQSRKIKIGEYYRLYAVCSIQTGGGSTKNFVLFSDNFGADWAVLGTPAQCPVASNADEPKAEELPDGSVLLAARGYGGGRNFNIFRYTDIENGLGKWDNFINTNMGFGAINKCNGEAMILPVKDNQTGEQTYLMLQSFPYGGNREKVSIAYKTFRTGADIATPSAFGQNWEGRYQATTRGSAYSTMTLQHDHAIGFFFEENRPETYDGVYMRLTLEEITDDAYSYQEDADGAAAKALTQSLIELRAANYTAPTNLGYVGEPLEPNVFANALDAYEDNPTEENYIALNKAEYNPDVETIPLEPGRRYYIISAHEGTYANYTEPRYLSTDGSKLTTTTDQNEANASFVIQPLESGNYRLFQHNANVYVKNTSGSTNNDQLVSANEADAGEYRIVNNGGTHHALVSVNPGNTTYPALHMNGSARAVNWSVTSPASQWYLLAIDDPNFTGIEEIEGSAAELQPERFYDLQGRLVAVPTRGQLYITSRGRKLIAR